MDKQQKIARLREIISAIDPKVFDDLCLVAKQEDQKQQRRAKIEKLDAYKRRKA